jgi:chemotaxis protein methyltransferase CheR
MGLQLTPQLFAIFASLVEDESGLHYSEHDRPLFESKLVTQASEAGFDSLLDYYYRLRYDDPDGKERRALVEGLVVHETYFFRELPSLVQLIDGPITDLLRARGRIRIWSAACSTGEEPITLAILMDQRGMLDRVEIVATDISAAAIAKASSGVHGARSLRDGHPVELARRYLDAGTRAVTVSSKLQSAIRFSVVNLFDEARVRALGGFDVIVCRNVLIYFRDSQISRVIDTLRGVLAADGLIVVGVSESLMRFGTGLVCEERGGAFFYRSAR